MENIENQVKQRLLMIKEAVSFQAGDEGLWSVPYGRLQSIGEACLQQALRDLHRVIEDGDEQALVRIKRASKDD